MLRPTAAEPVVALRHGPARAVGPLADRQANPQAGQGMVGGGAIAWRKVGSTPCARGLGAAAAGRVGSRGVGSSLNARPGCRRFTAWTGGPVVGQRMVGGG